MSLRPLCWRGSRWSERRKVLASPNADANARSLNWLWRKCSVSRSDVLTGSALRAFFIADAFKADRILAPCASAGTRLKGFRHSSSNGNAFPQVVSHYRRAALYEVLLPSWKRSSKIAFNVQFSYQLVPHEDRNNDFRFDHGRSRQIARILGNIIYHHGLSSACCGTA
jgi:hypothetical protein